MCNFDIIAQGIVLEANNIVRYCPVKKITTDLKNPRRDLSITYVLSKSEEENVLTF